MRFTAESLQVDFVGDRESMYFGVAGDKMAGQDPPPGLPQVIYEFLAGWLVVIDAGEVFAYPTEQISQVCTVTDAGE